ncbi:MAG TPA: TolC family protein [Bacteroidota bacterium]|nr:TolC family protein [Bacteroidota bacterium]
MMKSLCAFTLTAILLSASYAQDTLTVDKMLKRLMQVHPAITQAEQNSHAAEARVLQLQSALMPDVTTEGTYAFLAPIAKLAFPGLGEFKLFPASNYDIHIAGRYTVYDFGKSDATIDLSRSRVQTSQDAIELTKTTLAYQAVRIFYAILLLEKSIDVQNEQIEALQQHLESTKRRVSAGTATSFDVLTTQVRVAAAQSQKIDLEAMESKQRSVLAQLLGLSSGSSVKIKGDFMQQPVPLNSDSLLEAAVRQRMELKMAKDAGMSAQLQQKVASLGQKPSLMANVSYGLKNGYIPNLDVLRGNWMAGIRAELPIFDGGRTDHQQEEARAQVLAEEARQKDIQQQIRSDVEQAVTEVHSAAQKIAISEIQVKQAADAVSIAKSRYEIGTVTNLDLLDAQATESSARLGNLQALYKLVLSKYELDRAIGVKLTE